MFGRKRIIPDAGSTPVAGGSAVRSIGKLPLELNLEPSRWSLPIHSGKVRDIYEYGNGLLIVTSDRISAFDVVMVNSVPGKGKVLNQLSLFWFGYLKGVVPNHLISAEVENFPEPVRQFGDVLAGRTMWCQKAEVIKVEAVVRGYLAGSGWKSYQQSGEVCGHKLPPGLRQGLRTRGLVRLHHRRHQVRVRPR